jgi:hypothetical protein
MDLRLAKVTGESWVKTSFGQPDYVSFDPVLVGVSK